MRSFCIVTASAICLLCLTLLPGEARGQTDGKRNPRTPVPKTSTARTHTPVLSDDALQRAIARRFSQSKIGVNGFSVSVSEGTATLSGVAQVSQHKGVATRLAKAAGAREVINRIEISPEARAKARGAAKGSQSQPSRTGPSVRGGTMDGRTGVMPGAAARQPAPIQPTAPAPATPPRGTGDSVQEPEAFDRSQASNRVGMAKKFRILPGQPSESAEVDKGNPGTRTRGRRY